MLPQLLVVLQPAIVLFRSCKHRAFEYSKDFPL
jgi:hypothetical protein